MTVVPVADMKLSVCLWTESSAHVLASSCPILAFLASNVTGPEADPHPEPREIGMSQKLDQPFRVVVAAAVVVAGVAANVDFVVGVVAAHFVVEAAYSVVGCCVEHLFDFADVVVDRNVVAFVYLFPTAFLTPPV